MPQPPPGFCPSGGGGASVGVCPQCGRAVSALPGPGRPPTYCSSACKSRAEYARNREWITKGREAETMSIDVSGPLPTIEQLERAHFEAQLAAIEGRRDATARKTRERDADQRKQDAGEAAVRLSLNDAKARAWGALTHKAFVDFLRTGSPLEIPGPDGVVAKAALVEDGSGEYLIPTPIQIDIAQRAREIGTIRALADVRQVTGSKVRASLLGVASVGWGKAEVAGSITDAAVVPSAVAPDPTPVCDLVALALIGQDELADAPTSAVASIVDAVGMAFAVAEDNAFASGTGSGQPSGLALAANVTLVPAGQKTAAGASNTPVLADLVALPWKLPVQYRERAAWLMHSTAAGKIAALTFTNGSPLWPAPGNPDPRSGGGLLGWPAYACDGLPDPATAGTGDASVWFADFRSAYRIIDRQRVTVQVLSQRYADIGCVGLVVRERVGGDLVRPGAAAIYTM